MSNFLAATAFYHVSPTDVVKEIRLFLDEKGCEAKEVPITEKLVFDTDAIIFLPNNDWILVLWPQYFNMFDFYLTHVLARKNNWLISSIHVYDEDYWEHLAVQGDKKLHSFCSRPQYWGDDPDEQRRVALSKPDPEDLAKVLNLSTGLLTPYLVDADDLLDEGKAFDSDEFELDDYWVFTDFWQKLGVIYPEDVHQNMSYLLRLDENFVTKLTFLVNGSDNNEYDL